MFREHAPRIYAVALRVVGNEADAEDVIARVLLRAVRRLDTWRSGATLATWLDRVTVGMALAVRRGRELGAPRRTPHTPRIEVGGLSRLIEAAIAALSPPDRAAYVCADVEGHSDPEAAAVLGLSLDVFRSRLYRARLLVRSAFVAHFEGRTGTPS